MLARILTALVGLAIAVVGGFFLYVEMQNVLFHKGNVYLFAGIMCGGTALVFLTIAPSAVFDRVKTILSLKFPSITIGKSSSPPSEEGK